MRRTNGPALTRLAGWLALVLCTGWMVWVYIGTWWVIPAMTVHGIVLVHHFSLQHECIHFTAFRQRWINDAVAYFCGFVIMLPPTFFRYEHTDHHTYTQTKGRDPELIELPASLSAYLIYLSAFPYWKMQFCSMGRKLAGRISEEEKRFVPDVARPRVILEVRLMVVAYLVIVAAMIAFNGWTLVWVWWLPILLGEPFMRAIRMTEHVGRPNVADMTLNTRTNLVSAPLRFLCWNMNYHAEHHFAASVPFHALPRLHERLAGHVALETGGYLGAHRDILAQIQGRKPRADGLASRAWAK